MSRHISTEKLWTVLELIRWGTEYFQTKDVDSPRLTIELMLCSVLECTRISLYSNFERPLKKEELQTLRGYVQRRALREPLQYILSEADFYSLKLHVTPDVLIPRQETELLVEFVIETIDASDKARLRCFDIGTGSGCIPVAVAYHREQSIWLASDKDQHALEVARTNIDRYDLHDSVSIVQGDFLVDMPSRAFDIITMNPPYIPSSEVPDLEPEVRDYEPHVALTDDSDGLTFYRRMAEIGHNILEDDGVIVMELGWQGAEEVLKLFRGGWKTRIIDDLSGIPRVLVAHKDL